jgi:hypothetical protein
VFGTRNRETERQLRRRRIVIWDLILRLTSDGAPVTEQRLVDEARRNEIDEFFVRDILRDYVGDGDVEVVSGSYLPRGIRIVDGQGQISRAPTNVLDRNRAQALATMIQSQDGVTWLAFSLAITMEAVLLAAFVQKGTDFAGRTALFVAGFALAVIFMKLVRKSNADMGNYYLMAALDYPDTFHFPDSTRAKGSAGDLMSWTLVSSALGWVLLYIIYFCLDNPMNIAPFIR